MKHLLSFLLTAVLSMGFFACTDNSEPANNTAIDKTNQPKQIRHTAFTIQEIAEARELVIPLSDLRTIQIL